MLVQIVQVLLIGDTARSEFQDAVAVLESLAQVSCFADLESAAAAADERNLAAPIVVLAQSYPGQFAEAAVDRLRSVVPLARVIALLGTWCEGEPRSGHPLPGVVRVYWHQAAVRFRRELPRWGERAASTWLLPLTATDEDRLLAAASAPLCGGKGLVAVCTRHVEMEGFLSAACRKAGYATAWLPPRQPGRVRGAVAAIYDGSSLDDRGLAELQEFAAGVAPAKVLALLEFPRIEEAQRAASMGVRVLAKPVDVEDLLETLATLSVRGEGEVFSGQSEH